MIERQLACGIVQCRKHPSGPQKGFKDALILEDPASLITSQPSEEPMQCSRVIIAARKPREIYCIGVWMVGKMQD